MKQLSITQLRRPQLLGSAEAPSRSWCRSTRSTRSLAAAAASASSWRSSSAGSTSTSIRQLAPPQHFIPAPVSFYPGGGAAAPPPAWHPKLWLAESGSSASSARESALRASVADFFSALSDRLPAALPAMADGVTFFTDECDGSDGSGSGSDGADAFGVEAVGAAVATHAPPGTRYVLEDVLVDAERGTAVAHYRTTAAAAGTGASSGSSGSRGTGTFRFDRLGRITSVLSLRQRGRAAEP